MYLVCSSFVAREATSPPERVLTRYTRAKDYRVTYADGAVVGSAAGRALTIDFYVGNYDLPDILQVKGKDGNYTTEIKEDKDVGYNRELQVQIIITPENAIGLIEGIKQRLELFKQPLEDETE